MLIGFGICLITCIGIQIKWIVNDVKDNLVESSEAQKLQNEDYEKQIQERDYYDSLWHKDRKMWFAQELWAKSQLGIETMTDSQLRQLTPRKKVASVDQFNSTIHEFPNYEMIYNKFFQRDIQFSVLERRD